MHDGGWWIGWDGSRGNLPDGNRLAKIPASHSIKQRTLHRPSHLRWYLSRIRGLSVVGWHPTVDDGASVLNSTDSNGGVPISFSAIPRIRKSTASMRVDLLSGSYKSFQSPFTWDSIPPFAVLTGPNGS